MISLHSTIIVISWLATLSSSFSPGLPSVSVSSPASQHHDFLNVNGASYSCKCNDKSKRRSGSPTPIAPLHLSQSANDTINGFHYEVSKQDLYGNDGSDASTTTAAVTSDIATACTEQSGSCHWSESLAVSATANAAVISN